MPLWGGRFSKNLDKTTNDFNSSFPFDARLIHDDLEGSLAHTEMLRAQKIINNQDAKKIRQGLLAIQAKIQHLDSPSVYDLIKIFDLETYQKYSPLFKSDLYRAIDLRTCVKNRCTPGGPSPLVMRPYLTKLKKKYA
jgi:argininosuccinate lyase